MTSNRANANSTSSRGRERHQRGKRKAATGGLSKAATPRVKAGRGADLEVTSQRYTAPPSLIARPSSLRGDGTGASTHRPPYLKHKIVCLRRVSGDFNKEFLDNLLAITWYVPFQKLPENCPVQFSELKNSAGIYLLFHAERLLYIGYSNWLKYRLTGHAQKWLSLDPDFFPTHCEVLSFQDLDLATQMESLLIEAFYPPLNRTTKAFDRITDEQRNRTRDAIDREDTFADYGLLETETNVFFGWYRCFDDVVIKWIELSNSGGNWRMVTPKDYSF